MTNNVGMNISELRRQAGLTQEQLGKAVGVSTQAVSRWECGGTPDITLLPAIADRLGVSIDRLFGRDNAHTDVMELAANYMVSLPQQDRAAWLCKLLWKCANRWVSIPFSDWDALDYLDDFLVQTPTETESHWARSELAFDDSMLLGSPNRQLHFFLVAEEPEEGYLPYLLSPAQYETLFRTLAAPHSVEVLFYLYQCRLKSYILPGTIAARLKLDVDAVRAILEQLHQARLVEATDVEMESGMEKAYQARESVGIVLFFLFARWIQEKDAYFLAAQVRKTPIFRKDDSQYAADRQKSRPQGADPGHLPE